MIDGSPIPLRALEERNVLEQDLRLGIDNGSLRLHYQPIVTLAGEVRAMEALVRWQHPRRGLVAPMDFIPLAEETGLIITLGAWVLDNACRQVAAWRETLAPSLELSVNLGTRQLADPCLTATVKDALALSAIDASALCLEITDAGLLLESEAAVSSLEALRELGVRVAVDDFGTGSSSLLCLKRFPVQILKLDGSFVSGICHNHDDAAIAGSVVRLAHSLRLSTVAEGVETVEQRAVLEDLGCEQAQGFLWSPAREPEAITKLLESPGRLPPSLAPEEGLAWPALAEL